MTQDILPEVRQPTVLERLLPVLHQALTDSLGDRLDQVVLFGSQARGDAGPTADVDVLVVVNDELDYGDLIRRTSRLIGELSLGFDVVISRAFVSRERFESEQSPFLINVRREGVPLGSERSRNCCPRREPVSGRQSCYRARVTLTLLHRASITPCSMRPRHSCSTVGCLFPATRPSWQPLANDFLNAVEAVLQANS